MNKEEDRKLAPHEKLMAAQVCLDVGQMVLDKLDEEVKVKKKEKKIWPSLKHR